MESTTHALKEWSTAVNALEAGKTIVLLRKGGIREQGKRFQVVEDIALLYPTFEHQKPDLLKPEYAASVEPVPSGWYPETVRIASWVKITDIFPLSDRETLQALLPYHIWNERFAGDRFNWKPGQPLQVLLLKTYKLPKIYSLAYSPKYGGCKSWIELAESISLAGSEPVLDDLTYRQRVEEICQIVKGEQKSPRQNC
jgi:hypothetical protein